MSYELLDKPLLWVPVTWPGLVPGDGEGLAKSVEHEIECLVELKDKDEVRAILCLDVPDEPDEFLVVKTLCAGWRKIVANGSPLPFTDDNIQRLVRRPGFIQGFTIAYLAAANGRVKEREGNSESSPSSGRAGEATGGTVADAKPQ